MGEGQMIQQDYKTRCVICVLLIVWISISSYLSLEKPRINALEKGLEMGRLAALPQSATEIKVDISKSIFSETVRVKFKANRKEINSFISKSDGLKNVVPGIFTYNKWENDKWISPKTIIGLTYEIPIDWYTSYETVIIDVKNDIVYITTSHR